MKSDIFKSVLIMMHEYEILCKLLMLNRNNVAAVYYNIFLTVNSEDKFLGFRFPHFKYGALFGFFYRGIGFSDFFAHC